MIHTGHSVDVHHRKHPETHSCCSFQFLACLLSFSISVSFLVLFMLEMLQERVLTTSTAEILMMVHFALAVILLCISVTLSRWCGESNAKKHAHMLYFLLWTALVALMVSALIFRFNRRWPSTELTEFDDFGVNSGATLPHISGTWKAISTMAALGNLISVFLFISAIMSKTVYCCC